MTAKSAKPYVLEYIDRFLFEPQRNWPEDYFYERIAGRFAAAELLHRIDNYPEKDIYELEKYLIELFYKMSYAFDSNEHFSIMYSQAQETIENISIFIVKRRKRCHAKRIRKKRFKIF